MTNNSQIAETMLAFCLQAGHKPGKVQFTKYLYLLDYAMHRLEGRRLSSFPWRFYHFGPWCEDVEDCMSSLARQYHFGWMEDEFSVLSEVVIPVSDIGVTPKSLMQAIIQKFKNVDPNDVLEVAYSHTEPMLAARRGDILSFDAVPFDRMMPLFLSRAQRPKTQVDYRIPETVQKNIARLHDRVVVWRTQSAERRAFRSTPAYHDATALLKTELGETNALPQLYGSITPEAADSMAVEG